MILQESEKSENCFFFYKIGITLREILCNLTI